MLPIDDSQQRYQHRQQTEIESNLTSSHGCNKRVFSISLPVAGLATKLWVAAACPAICIEARVTTLAERMRSAERTAGAVRLFHPPSSPLAGDPFTMGHGRA